MIQTLNKTLATQIKPLLTVAALALFISLFYGIEMPLFDVDEGAFSEASREMLSSNNFISPRLDSEPRYDKPILIYWLQSASMHLFGINEWGARLPSALASCLWAVSIFLFLCFLGKPHSGAIAAIIMASCLEISIIGKAATADTLLNLCIASSMFCFFIYFTRHQKHFLIAAFIGMGLGFLTKGPVAVLIPVAVTFLFAGIAQEQSIKHWLKSMLNPIGILLFLIIVLPWYIAEYLHDGFDFIEGFFFKHNLSRFNQAMETHSGGWWYYLPIILIGLLPFSAVLYPVFKHSKQALSDPLKLFLLLWFAFVLILFSIASTKLPHYIVYGFTPLFILIAAELEKKPQQTLHAGLFLPAIFIFILLTSLPIIVAYTESNLTNPATLATYASLKSSFGLSYIIVQCLFLILAISPLIVKPLRKLNMLFLYALCLSWDINHYILPTVAEAQQRPIKEAALLAKQNHWNIIHWRIKAPSFSFYRQQASLHTLPEKGDIVLTKQSFLSDFDRYSILYLKNGTALVRIH